MLRRCGTRSGRSRCTHRRFVGRRSICDRPLCLDRSTPHLTADPTADPASGRDRRNRRDIGATLTELLITVMLLGLVTASLSAAVVVMVRQQDNSEGRLNVARAEASLGLWLPSDLASADTVDDTAGASPCGTTCPANAVTGGSNALMVSWQSIAAGPSGPLTTTVNVSYRYVQVGPLFQLVRVECQQTASGPWSCTNIVLLRDLGPPPGGVTWTPGVTSPDWLFPVSDPIDAGSTGSGGPVDPNDPLAPRQQARRVTVTVDGGGDADGSGGGVNVFSLTAGSAVRTTIDPTSTAGTPSFTAARSRCGGNYGLIIDDSGSIGGEMPTIIAGVQNFIDAFAGTPVKLQVVRFDSQASVIGENPRTRYFDMLNDADVDELRTAVGGLVADGGTNWEDAFHRMFYTETGSVQSVLPETVLFFTDGQPTWHRMWATTSPAAPVDPPAAQPELISAGWYDQQSFNRAQYIVEQFRSAVNLIGVGVGPTFSGTSPWLGEGAGWHYDHFRGFHYEVRANATAPWEIADQPTYDAAPAGNRRIATTFPYDYWEPITEAEYDYLPSEGRRREKDYSLPFTNFDPVEVWTPNSTILARLIAGDDTGIPAESLNGQYVNAASANMYLLPDWNQFAGALEAVAVAECGGTLTVQSRMNGQPAPETFVYQHVGSTDSGGLPVAHEPTTVTTTSEFRSGTFDFALTTGSAVTVEIQPVDNANVLAYRTVSWECKAGPDMRPVVTTPIGSGKWSGVRVQIRPNEALSCVHHVTK